MKKNTSAVVAEDGRPDRGFEKFTANLSTFSGVVVKHHQGESSHRTGLWNDVRRPGGKKPPPRCKKSAALYGPYFALEVGGAIPTASLAAKREDPAGRASRGQHKLFHSAGPFRRYTSNDCWSGGWWARFKKRDCHAEGCLRRAGCFGDIPRRALISRAPAQRFPAPGAWP